MWSLLWNWIVVGAVVLLLLGGGINFMASPHPLVADGFFTAATMLFLAKFVTWEEAHNQASGRAKVITLGVSISLIVLLIAIGGNHLLNRSPNAAIKETDLRVDAVESYVYEGKPVVVRVKVGNHGSTRARNPRHTLVVLIRDGVMGDLGERQLFERLRDSTTSSVSESILDIAPGGAALFTVGTSATHPVDGENVPLSPDTYKKFESGKYQLYVMILLQYGEELSKSFSDGLYRAHSVFCAHFTKGISESNPPEGPYYCNGFNYSMP